MGNPVSLSDLKVALEETANAWDLAQAAADALPPYLADDELTVDRFYERNKEKMSQDDARAILEEMVKAGKLDKQQRRTRNRSGAHYVFVYVAKG